MDNPGASEELEQFLGRDYMYLFASTIRFSALRRSITLRLCGVELGGTILRIGIGYSRDLVVEIYDHLSFVEEPRTRPCIIRRGSRLFVFREVRITTSIRNTSPACLLYPQWSNWADLHYVIGRPSRTNCSRPCYILVVNLGKEHVSMAHAENLRYVVPHIPSPKLCLAE